MKTIKRVKKSIKVISKNLKEKKVIVNKIQELLLKKHTPHNQVRSRSYTAVEYFLKNKPIENKIYNSDIVLKNNDSSTHFIGSSTRKSLLKVFSQFKGIIGIEKKENNANLFKTFKFVK